MEKKLMVVKGKGAGDGNLKKEKNFNLYKSEME